MTSVPLAAYLVLALGLFSIGLYGALAKRNPIIRLISIEFMLNAAIINLLAFSKLGWSPSISGQVFSLFIMAIAAAEAAVGLAILIVLYRNKNTVHIEKDKTQH
ncbi:NADH-quinone oxidoreductase subunit NuoK [Bacillus massiliglaciei]|uniref:NADH-quinone oxidoreductase subunit NuoK n=1 Tax=Bacillus massiliglaciei TaxID=1816693 RepID=UPI000AD090B4|nr:NADH-quinone oxidoreductase subunit NuoK [Bacillus massiliglaciei]